MADEKKSDGNAKKEAKEKAKAEAAPAGADPAAPHCRVAKCKQPVRAKGYCRKHYIAWRREDVGEHHRYKICSKEGCRKRRAVGGLCEEHAGTGAKAEGGAAT
jgi:hypothetical protein